MFRNGNSIKLFSHSHEYHISNFCSRKNFFSAALLFVLFAWLGGCLVVKAFSKLMEPNFMWRMILF